MVQNHVIPVAGKEADKRLESSRSPQLLGNFEPNLGYLKPRSK